jgi:hypothetical protein
MVLAFVIAGLALGGGAAEAASVDVGAVALQQSLSTRAIGMAQTGTADPSDPLNTYLNPSLVPVREGIALSYFRNQWLSNIISDITFQGVNLSGMGCVTWSAQIRIVREGSKRKGVFSQE